MTKQNAPKCPNPYHDPDALYCLKCLPKDAPLATLLIGTRPPTADEIKRGLESWHREPAAPPEGETAIEVSAEQPGHYKTVTGTETWAVASPAMSGEPPCKTCGHTRERHEEEQPYPCYDCDCQTFSHVAAPPAGMTAEEFWPKWNETQKTWDDQDLAQVWTPLLFDFAEAHTAHLRGEVEQQFYEHYEGTIQGLRGEVERLTTITAGKCGACGVNLNRVTELELDEQVIKAQYQKMEERAEQAEAELARLRRAALTFYANRGQHEGEHEPLGKVCSKCTAAYVAAESEFDAAFGLQGTPAEARAVLESTTSQEEK